MQGPVRLAPDLEASLAHCGADLDLASRVALASASPAAQLQCVQAIQSARPQQRTMPAFIQGVIHGVISTLNRCEAPWMHTPVNLTLPESSKFRVCDSPQTQSCYIVIGSCEQSVRFVSTKGVPFGNHAPDMG